MFDRRDIDAQLAVLSQRRALMQRLLRLANDRVDAGEASRLDVVTLDAERVSLDVEITQMTSERREKRLTLARQIGKPSGPIEWELAPWHPVTLTSADEVAWVRAALKRRPEVP